MTRLLFCLVLGCFLMLGDSSSRKKDDLIPLNRRATVVDFNLGNVNGGMVRLSGLQGKVVVVNFWATWCGGCKLELPWLVEFDKKYRSKGLVTIGISMDEGGEKAVKPFLVKKDIRYPVVIGSEHLAEQYGVTAMPMTLLVDKSGKVAVSHTGVIDREEFESEIGELLREPSNP